MLRLGGNKLSSYGHALGRTAVTGGVAGGTALASYHIFGNDLETALFHGNIATIPGGMLARKIVPCFPAGTTIRTPLGFKPIEEIQADDLVLSRPEEEPHADVGYQRVLEAHQRVGEILTIHIGGREIQTTTEHPFFVRRWENPNRPSDVYALQSDGGLATATVDPVISHFDWTEAQDLRPGDEVSTSDGRWLTIDRIERDGTETVVYNMTVEEWHTYFIGQPDWGFDVWVHNTHKPSDIGRAALNKVSGWSSELNKLDDTLLDAVDSGPRHIFDDDDWLQEFADEIDEFGFVKGNTHGHHSDPIFMGGDRHQELTKMPIEEHKQLHRDLNDFLVTKTDGAGNHMRPQAGNSGDVIQTNFDILELREAMSEFYKANRDKYAQAARDFFTQHPTLE